MPAAYAAGPAATPSDSLPSVTLEELSVTAVKQRSILREQPVAATLLTGAQLDELNVVTIKGISDVVPNFYIPDYGSRITSTIYVRGLGARMDQPAVGLSVDNVPFLNKDCYDFDIADIVSVDMLRGPQSTLYGRNTMGGQINVTTLSPMRYQGWRLNTEIGTGGNFKLSTGWYHKFHPDFAFAAVGSFTASRGFFTNEYNGRKIDRERLVNLRLKQDWRVTRSTYLQNALSANFLRQGGYPYEFKETGQISYNDTCFYHRLMLNDGLTVRHNGEKVYLTSITSWQYIDDNMTLDQDFLPLSYFTLRQSRREHGITQDLVFRSREAGRYRWLCGAFGFYRGSRMEAPVNFKRTGIEELILKNANTGPVFRYESDAQELLLASDFRMPAWGAALYHESDLTAGRWRFSAGLRADFEHTGLSYRSRTDFDYRLGIEGGEPQPQRATIDDRDRLTRTYFELLPRLAVTYSFDEVRNLYLSVAKGYKTGGFNTQIFSDILQEKLKGRMVSGVDDTDPGLMSYRPEHSWNVELGGHFSCCEGLVRGDFALFWIECRDQQLTVFPAGTSTGRMMTNAGRSRSLGGELSLRVVPCDDLVLDAAYGYTDARFVRYDNGREDFAGKRIPYAPEHTFSLNAEWSIPTGVRWLGDLVLRAETRGTGPIRWNEENTRTQSFYLVADASVRLEHPRYAIDLWSRNLGDCGYEVFYFKSMGNEFVQRGRPRTFGITLSISY